MSRVAIAFLSKNRVELTRRTIEPLLSDKFDLWCFDGSTEPEATHFIMDQMHFLEGLGRTHFNVRGGADAAIVYALTHLLEVGADGTRPEYTHIGLCENDVLLGEAWFDRTMGLFDQGHSDGIHVGAVSPRCYVDRVLIQRDGYAVCHNLGAGCVIFTRESARMILGHYRNAWAPDNRSLFSYLSGIDIGPYWAFKGAQQWLTVDWGFDATLASYGLASLALTPSPVEMIGQNPPLVEQGLELAVGDWSIPPDALKAFALYKMRLSELWHGQTTVLHQSRHLATNGTWTIFPHQIPSLVGASYEGLWQLKWTQGFGPFSWVAGRPLDWRMEPAYEFGVDRLASLTVQVSGVVQFLVSGGQHGAKIKVEDRHSGYVCEPDLSPEGVHGRVMTLPVAGASFREIRLTCEPGAVLYGLQTNEPQPTCHAYKFDHSQLPPPL